MALPDHDLPVSQDPQDLAPGLLVAMRCLERQADEINLAADREADPRNALVGRASAGALQAMIAELGAILSGGQPAPEGPAEALDQRLLARGMLSVAQMNQPASRFEIHAGMDSLDIFGVWLEKKARRYTEMRCRMLLEGGPEEDDLEEWILAHAGACHNILVNFRAARERDKMKEGETHDHDG